MIHELEEVNKVLQFKSLIVIRKTMQTCNSLPPMTAKNEKIKNLKAK